jgi:hypothetical protein
MLKMKKTSSIKNISLSLQGDSFYYPVFLSKTTHPRKSKIFRILCPTKPFFNDSLKIVSFNIQFSERIESALRELTNYS